MKETFSDELMIGHNIKNIVHRYWDSHYNRVAAMNFLLKRDYAFDFEDGGCILAIREFWELTKDTYTESTLEQLRMLIPVTFHPDTVIIKYDDITTTEQWLNAPNIINLDDINALGVTRPIFDHIAVECIADNDTNVVIYGSRTDVFDDKDGTVCYLLFIMLINPHTHQRAYTKTPVVAIYHPDGKLERFFCHGNKDNHYWSFDDDLCQVPYPYALSSDNLNEEHSTGFFFSYSVIMSYLHKKADIELIDYPRNYRRRVKRKTGKEPSPYFLLKVGNEKRKQSDNTEYTNIGSKSKAPLHIVRGHFRHVENHPLPQFNGTFWIPAHTRGNKENGEVKKGYTIRLPDKAA